MGNAVNSLGFTIIIDTREQDPYPIEGAIVKGLKTGDYSIEGMEERLAIERKSKADAYGSIGIGRERFEREMIRMKEYEYAAIIIESSLKNFLIPPRFSNLNPKSAVNSLLSWSIQHGIHIFFAEDRHYGQSLVINLCKMFYKHKKGGTS